MAKYGIYGNIDGYKKEIKSIYNNYNGSLNSWSYGYGNINGVQKQIFPRELEAVTYYRWNEYTLQLSESESTLNGDFYLVDLGSGSFTAELWSKPDITITWPEPAYFYTGSNLRVRPASNYSDEQQRSKFNYVLDNSKEYRDEIDKLLNNEISPSAFNGKYMCDNYGREWYNTKSLDYYGTPVPMYLLNSVTFSHTDSSEDVAGSWPVVWTHYYFIVNYSHKYVPSYDILYPYVWNWSDYVISKSSDAYTTSEIPYQTEYYKLNMQPTNKLYTYSGTETRYE